MNTTPWIDRIQTQCPGLRFVGGALDLSEATLQAVVPPAAFVIPVSETGEPIDMAGLQQKRHQVWAVAIVIKAMPNKAGTDPAADLAPLRDQIRDALQGWAASPKHTPTQFDAGQLEAMEKGSIVWIDQYTTSQAP